MTPAEQMAERLENRSLATIDDTADDAAAMIRRLSAALVAIYELEGVNSTWATDHADALRDVGAKV